MPQQAFQPDRKFHSDLVVLRPDLLRRARRLCTNPELAEDLVQEALLRAINKESTFQPGTNVRAWMFTILRNLFYANWHKEKRLSPWEPHMDEMFHICGGQEHAVSLSQVVARLFEMPEPQRVALVLVAVGGCSYEEAAEIEQCAVGTMKSRVSRARARLASSQARTHLPVDQTGLDIMMSLCGDVMQRRAAVAAGRVPEQASG